MIIKLIRTDTIDSCKIPLDLGEHVIGRGKLLGCDDKRISRHHGKLEVSDDTLSLEALHQNPCFFTSKSSTEVVILRQGNSKTLLHGDRFGLLPDAFWYEVLFCQDLEEPNYESEKNTEEYCVDSTDRRECDNERTESLIDNPNKPDDCNEPDDHNGLDNHNKPDVHNETDNHNEPDNHNESVVHKETDDDSKPNDHDEPVDHNESANHNEFENVQETEKSNESSKPDQAIVKKEPNEESSNKDGNDSNEQSKQMENRSIKRSHSPDCLGVAKIKAVVKNEPDEDKPGPSLNQGQAAANSGASNVNNGASNDARNNNPLRERCMYGANCYRRRPEHLSRYSHPRDADWGPGARGVCPYGAACAKADPRHWRDHDHPPGKLPPPRPGMRAVERHGNVYFINARTVNFYDDHFQVEDSDGDSVDYDYEF